ncbi:MAG: hypothetical protein MMC33_010248 [Icmadophila ericetorum]|nr:hypothetical protein [Icmadophila ericetorum]
MPAFPPAATPLSGPAAGLYLYHVAIGRGTQNYTCANETAVPTSIGAKATLYNASCIAASYPTVLSSLPSAALQVPSGDIPDSLLVSGHHYFSNATTPTFDLGSFGFSHFKKVGTENATAGSNPGVAGQAYGAVAWLKLEHETQGAVGDLMEVYRLNTAGGSPPPTCAGMPAAFEIQYSAEYWFWAGTES